jgi:uncharacterized metal-binding protein
MASCTCDSGTAKKNVLIYSCSGAANVAEISDRVARRLMKEGAGAMFCLAGLGAELPNMVETAKKADFSLVLDGCPIDCARKIIEKVNLVNTKVIRITDLGIAKAKGVPVTDEQVEIVYQEAKRILATA